jgi:hypothetical protein
VGVGVACIAFHKSSSSQPDKNKTQKVDDAHARLVAATRALFDRYKAQYPGYERRELVIV